MGLTGYQKETIENYYVEMYYLLSGYAFSVLRNYALAEEAVQETFRIACTRVDTLLASPNPKGWLVAVLKNVIRNTISTRRHLDIIMSSEQDCEALAGSADVEIPLELQLSGLASDEDLHLLCRVAVDGCSVAAAADELGIGIEACKKRLQRVRARLKKQMQADW